MKSLKDKLNESLLDDEDELFDRNDKTLIELWIKENYKIYGILKIYEDKHGFVVDSNDKIEVTNKNIKSLTNGMFRWGEITGGFNCENCEALTSLEGVPKKCSSFYCAKCTELRSLEDAPNECWGCFNCSGCIKLTSLKGTPSECEWFKCFGCTELRSLEGAPNECYSFDCSGCTELISLKGAPNKCKDFNCSGCTELRTLEGAPNKCEDLYCSKCTELRSLKGAPVGATIKCSGCTNLIITDNERKKYKIRS